MALRVDCTPIQAAPAAIGVGSTGPGPCPVPTTTTDIPYTTIDPFTSAFAPIVSRRRPTTNAPATAPRPPPTTPPPPPPTNRRPAPPRPRGRGAAAPRGPRPAITPAGSWRRS